MDSGLDYWIPGDKTAPSNVRLTRDAINPHDALKLSWKRATLDPMTYSVTAFEMHEDGTKTVGLQLLTTNTTATLSNLTHLTKYYCEVVAKYQNEKNGKSVPSNSMETADLPPDTFKPNKVQAMKDSNNPSRQIIVKWKPPVTMWENLTVSHYEVRLIYGDDMKTEIQAIKGKYKCRFENLKSNTAYRASVVTVKGSIETQVSKSKESFSDEVVTDPAQQTPGFDIKIKGQAIIKICEANYKPNSEVVTGSLEWALPNLGIEENNYKLYGVSVSVETEGEEKRTLNVEEQTKCNSILLKRGRTYTLTVECNYMNPDSSDGSKAQTCRLLTTDIENPSITDIACHDKTIAITWSKPNGAVKYVLKILDEKKSVLFESKELHERQNTTSIVMNNSYSYGKTCKFLIEASGRNGKIVKASKKILIGGDFVTTDVVIIANGRRGMIAFWKPPKQVPKEYQVLLYEISGPNFVRSDLRDEIALIEQTCTSHSFMELKSNTFYCCQVYPIYHKGPGHGSVSNAEKTAQRMQSTQEEISEFGKPEIITHDIIAMENERAEIRVSWGEVKLGENFKVTGYRVVLKQKNRVYNSQLLEEVLKPCDTTITTNVDKGYEYRFEVYTIFKDLDTFQQKEKKFLYCFSTTPSQTKISDCTWKEGVIFFNWQPVNGATKYCLTIKDELFNEELAPDQIKEVMGNGDGCQAQVQMSEKLGIGRTCMTRVTVYAAKTSSVTEWKPHLIGGDRVARNVKATRNIENPTRALNVTFDSPKAEAAKEYKVVAVPESGKAKTQYAKSSPFVFEHLRKGVSYYFEVFAERDESWGLPSRSNSIFTEGQKSRTIFDIRGMTQLALDLRGTAVREENTVINVVKGNDFGKVMDLAFTLQDTLKSDSLKLHWLIPDFGRTGYKVEKFKVDIRKPNSGGKTDFLDFDKAIMKYCTEEYDLELGESYHVSVSTVFEDIERDIVYISSAAKCRINTRPCKPRILRNECKTELLTIEWSTVKGARRYEVELHMDNSSIPYVKETTDTKFTREFDKTFGYGTTYYAVVKAFGEENKFNQSDTKRQTIGGEYVVTNVSATIDRYEVNDPNTQVFLSWNAAQHQPEKYEFEPVPDVTDMRVSFYGDKECIVSGLKAGTHYYFKVVAVHRVGKEIIKSGGCCSNKVQTNPTPTQVRNVYIRPGDNPSTSVDVFWEKVDAEKQNETTTYKVCVASDDHTEKRTVIVETESTAFHHLEPGVLYFVTVAGGNSVGFGRKSEKTTFKTDLGTPKKVSLTNCANNPSTSLVVTFSLAEGDVLKYEGTLYKIQNEVKHRIREFKDMKSGNVLSDLESNSEYAIELHAVSKTGAGKYVSSNIQMTAPPKVIIDKYGCCAQDGEFSSREIFAKWKTYLGCHYHEVTILCGLAQSFESKFVVQDNNQIMYSCLHESTRYSIQVRSRNSSMLFGEYSDRKIIDLAPAKLEDVHATLSDVGCDIKVRCRRAQRHFPFYLMNAYCEGKVVTKEPVMKQPSDELAGIEWIFTPKNPAKKYTFELWGEDSRKVKGESVHTSSVTSRPSREEIQSIETLGSSPSTDICISWKGQERCDAYEISIRIKEQQEYENVVRRSQTSCTYRCLSPGNTYLVSVRAFSGSVWGHWSNEQLITLAPNEIQLIEDKTLSNDPVSSVGIKWKPLSVKPKGYIVKLFCDDEKVAEMKTQETEHLFTESIISGSLCHCTISAYNEEKIGKATKSKNYKITPEKLQNVIVQKSGKSGGLIKISWDPARKCSNYIIEIWKKGEECAEASVNIPNQIEYFYVCHALGVEYRARVAAIHNGVKGDWSDEASVQMGWSKPKQFTTKLLSDNPSEKATITWEHPEGINCFKLVIYGKEYFREFELVDNSLLFEDGFAGAVYNCRLYCGCDGQYDTECVTLDHSLIMAPAAPSGIHVVVEKNLNRIEVQFVEPEQIPGSYRLSALDIVSGVEYPGQFSQPYVDFERLVLGKEYRLLVQSEKNGILSKKVSSSIFVTYPPKVDKLRLLNCSNETALVKWDVPSPQIVGYTVKYKCGNKEMTSFVEATEFKLTGLKQSKMHYVSVAAINKSGQGEFSKQLEFQTALSNLKHVQISKSSQDPTGSLIVEFKDPDTRSKDYVIAAEARTDKNVSISNTQQQICAITGLFPGESYKISVRAQYGRKVSNDAYAPEEASTIPDKITNVLSESIGEERYRVRWRPLLFEPSYIIRWRSSAKDNYVEAVSQKSSFEWDLSLKSGCKYKVEVAAKNNAGRGEWSDPVTFTTAEDSNDEMDGRGQGNTAFEGEVRSANVYSDIKKFTQDCKKQTQMRDLRMVNAIFPGITNTPQNQCLTAGRSNGITNTPQSQCLTAGPSNVGEAIMEAVNTLLNPEGTGTDIHGTPEIAGPSTEDNDDESFGHEAAENTIPKLVDDENGVGGKCLNEDYESPSTMDQIRQAEGRFTSNEISNEHPSALSHEGSLRREVGSVNTHESDQVSVQEEDIQPCEFGSDHQVENQAMRPNFYRQIMRLCCCCISGQNNAEDESTEHLLDNDEENQTG